MERLTYRQAYDKIIEAYFRDEIKPNNRFFCFCGTLAGGDNWATRRNGIYLGSEYKTMELALFSAFDPYVDYELFPSFHLDFAVEPESQIPEYEERLFKGMSSALDVLKEIHRSSGENVDTDIPAFTKRELA